MLDLGPPQAEHLVVYAAAGLAASAALAGTLLLRSQRGADRGAAEPLPGDNLPKALFAAGLLMGALAIVHVVSG